MREHLPKYVIILGEKLILKNDIYIINENLV